MIGKVSIGKSLKRCLYYCLGKKQAEVLDQNMCGGEKQEIWQQMKEVSDLNQNVSRPMQHISLSMAKGEQLGRGQLIQLAEDCAKEMGFEKNQYIVVQHHDTEHQHIHIVINRIDYDVKTLSDSNNYKKIAEFCRRMELKYKLQQVLSPRRFQTHEQRQIPRSDKRKTHLKAVIAECLWKASSYGDFVRLIKLQGYETYKGWGIVFKDKKKVRIKGSEVGYSLQKIEKNLENKAQKQTLKQGQKLSLLPKKQSSGLVQKKYHNEEDILDILTEKQKFEENVNPTFKRKQQQRREI